MQIGLGIRYPLLIEWFIGLPHYLQNESDLLLQCPQVSLEVRGLLLLRGKRWFQLRNPYSAAENS